MAFSDFTLELAGRSLGVTTREADLFTDLAKAEVFGWLADLLGKRTQVALISEKARSEFIVAPILVASRELSPVPLAIFSGQRLDVDPSRGLVGECDFILATAPPVLPLRSPIVTIVEARKNDIEGSLGQCVAEMVAARIFNEQTGDPTVRVHGCVTTGEAWQFLSLDERGEGVAIDRRRLYFDDVGGILAAFQAIVARSAGAASHS